MTRHTLAQTKLSTVTAIARTTLARAGDVSDEVFSLLCTLDAFHLEGNRGINEKDMYQKTVTNLFLQPPSVICTMSG